MLSGMCHELGEKGVRPCCFGLRSASVEAMILAPSLRVRMQKASESIAADTATKAGTTSSCEGTGCAIEWPQPLTYPYSSFCSCFLCRPAYQ